MYVDKFLVSLKHVLLCVLFKWVENLIYAMFQRDFGGKLLNLHYTLERAHTGYLYNHVDC